MRNGTLAPSTDPLGYRGPVLLGYKRVADILDLPNPKDVYELDIPRFRLSPGRVRWASTDLAAFIEHHREGP